MAANRPLRIVFALGLCGAIALFALYVGRVVPLPSGGFVPRSFVTHSVMLALSLGLIWIMSRGLPALYGLTRGTYRFRPTILLWALPVAALSLPAALGAGRGEGTGAMGDFGRLQGVIFVWIYASVSEEVLTRGLLQTLLSVGPSGGARRARFSMPVVLSALFFGAMHVVLFESMGPAAVPVIAMVTLLGFVAAHYRETTGSLIPAVVVHALFNVGGMLPIWIAHWLRG